MKRLVIFIIKVFFLYDDDVVPVQHHYKHECILNSNALMNRLLVLQVIPVYLIQLIVLLVM